MINKSQIMTWRNIGYDAQELICRCDSNASVEKLAEMAEAIREKMNSLDILELKQLHTEKNIAFENVPGLFSHDKGWTFTTILSTLSELGYCIEWQLLNSADFKVPQSRKRMFAFGYRDIRCAGKVLPFTECNPQTLRQVLPGSQGQRGYDMSGLSCTLASNAGGQG